jgi:hypothetical protein
MEFKHFGLPSQEKTCSSNPNCLCVKLQSRIINQPRLANKNRQRHLRAAFDLRHAPPAALQSPQFRNDEQLPNRLI